MTTGFARLIGVASAEPSEMVTQPIQAVSRHQTPDTDIQEALRVTDDRG